MWFLLGALLAALVGGGFVGLDGCALSDSRFSGLFLGRGYVLLPLRLVFRGRGFVFRGEMLRVNGYR